MIIKTSKPQNYSDYNGTPDKISDRKDNLTKGSEVKFNMFNGWVDYPIYKELSEVDSKDLTSYNKEGIIYIYQPNHDNRFYVEYDDNAGNVEIRLVSLSGVQVLNLQTTDFQREANDAEDNN
jgi:hypothetical protein